MGRGEVRSWVGHYAEVNLLILQHKFIIPGSNEQVNEKLFGITYRFHELHDTQIYSQELRSNQP